MQGFPNPEDAVIEMIDDLGPAGTSTSPDLDQWPLRVNRVPPGGVDRLGLQDTATIRITAFDNTREQSVQRNAAVRMRLAGLRGIATAAGFIDSVTEDVAPVPDFDPNPDARKVTSTWTVVSRLQELPEPVAP